MDLEDMGKYSKMYVPNHIALEFIRTYGELEVLWDKKHHFYNNRRKRLEACNTLLNVLKKSNDDVDLQSVKRYINTLRSNYKGELNKIMDSRQEDDDGNVTYEYTSNQWKFIELYKFLRHTEELDESLDAAMEEAQKNCSDSSIHTDSLKTSKSKKRSICESSRSVSIEDLLCEDTGYEDSSSNGDKTPSNKLNKRLKFDHNTADNPLQDVEVHNLTVDSEDTDSNLDKEYISIGSNVAYKLKRMSSEQRCFAELLINKVLINGLRKNLREGTDLCGLALRENFVSLDR